MKVYGDDDMKMMMRVREIAVKMVLPMKVRCAGEVGEVEA